MVRIEKKDRGLTLTAKQIARWAIARENHGQFGNAWTTRPICDYGLWIQARYRIRSDFKTREECDVNQAWYMRRAKRDESITVRIEQLKTEYRRVENVHNAAGGRYSYNNVSFRNGAVLLFGIPDIGCTNGGNLVRTPHMRDLAEHYAKCEVIRESDSGRFDRYEVALIEGICGLHDKTELRYYRSESAAPEFRHEVVSADWAERSKDAANVACGLVAGPKPHLCGSCYVCKAITSLSWWKRLGKNL